MYHCSQKNYIEQKKKDGSVYISKDSLYNNKTKFFNK
jgi:hypothetical protein